jgi:predicted aconitase with swiveling domain
MFLAKRLTLKGRGISSGLAEGEAIVSKQPFMFAHGVDVATGIIRDKRHELCGKSIAGKVFVFPHGKGSTTGSAWILENLRRGRGPIAIVNLETEPIIAASAIMAKIFFNIEIPIVDRLDKNPFDIIETGDHVKVNGNMGIIQVVKNY